MVNQNLELSDIQNINDKLYKELSDLSKDKNINEKGLVYFYEGNELLIDGKNIKVDSNNVYDYIEKIINYENGKNKEKSKIIKSNLFNLIPKKYITYLTINLNNLYIKLSKLNFLCFKFIIKKFKN